MSPIAPRVNITVQDQSSTLLRTEQSSLRIIIDPTLHQSLMFRMSWVANELVCDGERFYMECVREPPEWFLWYYLWQISISYSFCRVWGSEETVSDYKARIRIFSVRHQDTTGVQERFEREKIRRNQICVEDKMGIESSRETCFKSLILSQVLEWSSYPTQCEQVIFGISI